MWQGGLDAMKLLGPFSKLLDGVVSDTFVRNWLNLLCFLLSGAAPFTCAGQTVCPRAS